MKYRLTFPKTRSGKVTMASISLATLILSSIVLTRQVPQTLISADAVCQQVIKETASIDRRKLAQLQGKEGVQKETVRQILGDPYCVLPKISIRSGAITNREVYPLAEEDDSRLIVAYESNQYLGYGIDSRSNSKLDWIFKPEKLPQLNYKEIFIKEIWEIQAGEMIAGHRVVGGLGDVSIEFKGSVLAPADGAIAGKFVFVSEKNLIKSSPDCLIFSSHQMPAYLMRFCGLRDRNLGIVKQGESIGKTEGYLHISLLHFRKTDGNNSQWIYVSPSPKLLEKLLKES